MTPGLRCDAAAEPGRGPPPAERSKGRRDEAVGGAGDAVRWSGMVRVVCTVLCV